MWITDDSNEISSLIIGPKSEENCLKLNSVIYFSQGWHLKGMK